MAQFYTYDFMYDGIPSQKFNLKIITFEDGSLFNGIGSSDVTILEQRVLRKSKPYYLGRTQETKLEFPLTFGTAEPISGMERDLISKWLFGRSEYKKLYILQDDLNGAYFKCFMTKPEPLYIGGINYAFTCQVVCDSPWAYSAPRYASGSAIGIDVRGYDYYFTIYNSSSEDEYLYPTFDFTVGTVLRPEGVWGIYKGGGIYMQNFTEGRVFKMESLSTDDSIHVDNDLQILSGSSPSYSSITGLLDRFNKKWTRLVPGRNDFGIIFNSIGDSLYYCFSWSERMKIGG